VGRPDRRAARTPGVVFFDLVEPGLVNGSDWRPGLANDAFPDPGWVQGMLSGVARKR
jgi:hypothetical protein